MRELIAGILSVLFCVAVEDFAFTLIFEVIRRKINVKRKHTVVFTCCALCALLYAICMLFITNVYVKLFISGILLAIVNIVHLEFQDIYIEYNCKLSIKILTQLVTWAILFLLTLLFFATPIIA
jgi:hypothetical protein